MSIQSIDLASLPVADNVVMNLKKIFANEDADLRDVTSIAFQEPVVLVNIIMLVNDFLQNKGRPVVNTLSAAINLLGMPVLSKSLLSLKSVDDLDLPCHQIDAFNIIRHRTFVAAHMTKFWAEYMGENNIEEQYCVSMFTGLKDMHQYLLEGRVERQTAGHSYLDTIDDIKSLYSFESSSIPKLPDSIQQVHMHSSYTRRLSLSILSYELVSALELGYSSEEFNSSLVRSVACFDQSISRAAYDFAIQVVELERSAVYKSYNHSRFLVSTNVEALDPLLGINMPGNVNNLDKTTCCR